MGSMVGTRGPLLLLTGIVVPETKFYMKGVSVKTKVEIQITAWYLGWEAWLLQRVE